MKIGFTHGRFQPFHKGHLNVLLYALKKYDEVWIGLSNPLRRMPHNFDTYSDKLKASILKARAPEKNQFTFVQRREMILKSLSYEGIDITKVNVIPYFAFYEEKNWEELVPDKENTHIVIHIKDEHHIRQIKDGEEKGWKHDIIKEKIGSYSGTEFWEKYPDGNWQEIVPQGTIEVILKTK